MVVDTTNNFLLTGSPDTNVHVWSIPTLLSFSTSSSTYDPSQPSPFSPVHTLSNHRDAITALVTGHSHSRANIAVSASKDKTCVVWDYQAGKMLHTFLLATTPLCATLDPADRALYVGFDDGSVQLIDFFKGQSSENPLYDAQKTHTPTQPSASDRWQAALEASPILSMDLSYDGSSLLTGHENGKVLQWDTGTGQSHGDVIADLIAPVTNLLMQRPQGFSHVTLPSSKSINIVKPSLDSSVVGEGSADVPRDYTYKAQFSQSISLPRFSKRTTYQAEQHDELMDDFEEAMCHSSFPTDLIEEGLKALSAPPESDGQSTDLLKGWQTDPRRDVLVAQDALTEARKAPDYLMGVIDDLSKEVERLQDGERARRRNKKLRKVRREKHEEAQRRKVMGEPVESDADMEDGDGDDSTSTDDMSAGE
jgi:pre-rRNA-processing protein IPI3